MYLKYIFFNISHLFIKQSLRNDKNTSIFISQNNLYYLALHLKLSSLFYSTQLIDLFAYDTSISLNSFQIKKKNPATPLLNNAIIVYQFNSVLFYQRFYIFIINLPKQNFNKNSLSWAPLNSISELFLNANWLERELAELHGVFFTGKKDLRNLLLQYGDSSVPMRKSFPSIGTREIFYDSVTDLLIQTPVSVQF